MADDPISAFTSIGMIAHHFESCELYLSDLFQLLCESENYTPFRTLRLIVSSDLRLQMAEIALQECLPRSSDIKTQIKEAFQEFRSCQKERKRAIHSALVYTIEGRALAWHHRPLPHQTHRYKDGGIKPGQEVKASALKEADNNILLLSLRMKSLVAELHVFLLERKARRMKRLALGLERQRAPD